MSEGKVLTANDLELSHALSPGSTLSLREIREQAEREHIDKILISCNWNISRAASKLDVSRPTLHDLIKKYRIKKKY